MPQSRQTTNGGEQGRMRDECFSRLQHAQPLCFHCGIEARPVPCKSHRCANLSRIVGLLARGSTSNEGPRQLVAINVKALIFCGKIDFCFWLFLVVSDCFWSDGGWQHDR